MLPILRDALIALCLVVAAFMLIVIVTSLQGPPDASTTTTMREDTSTTLAWETTTTSLATTTTSGDGSTTTTLSTGSTTTTLGGGGSGGGGGGSGTTTTSTDTSSTTTSSSSSTSSTTTTLALTKLSARNSGFYGGVAPWNTTIPNTDGKKEFFERTKDMSFVVRQVFINTTQYGSQRVNDSLTEIGKEIEEGWKASPKKRVLLRVYFYDGQFNDPLTSQRICAACPLNSSANYAERVLYALRFLGANATRLYAVTLAEETYIDVNASQNRAKLLSDIYTAVKAQYPSLPIYQWYIYTLGKNQKVPERYDANSWVLTDGWIIDAFKVSREYCGSTYSSGCGLGAKPYRTYLQKFVITGKPVVSFVYAGTGNANYELNDSIHPNLWAAIEEQTAVNIEFNIPQAYYWYRMVNGVDTPYFVTNPNDATQVRMNSVTLASIATAKALPPGHEGFPSQQSWESQTLNVSCAQTAVYNDYFSRNTLVNTTSGSGFRQLIWQPGGLFARNYTNAPIDANFTYRIHCTDTPPAQWTAKSTFSFTGSHNQEVEISLSTDGATWESATASSGGQVSVSLANGGAATDVWMRVAVRADNAKSVLPIKLLSAQLTKS